MSPQRNHQPSTHFPELLRVRTPPGFITALNLVADRRCTTVSEIVRQSILAHLEAQGVRLRAGAIETEASR
jgi:hypothetical protein